MKKLETIYKNLKIFFSPTLIQANVLELGWAATPAGVKAMEELSKLEEDRRSRRLPRPVRGNCKQVGPRIKQTDFLRLWILIGMDMIG